eukprot:GFUD01007573.1.p1 GENE.GFUD01007573.1~~GFUD01007573.1.p1  ORF type:complete len:702 (-),score=196.53 GFUD01007573.1:82-2139(-)
MQTWKRGMEGSVWNIFQQKAVLDDDLKDILDEVVSVKKVSMSSRASILEMLQIKTTSNNGAASETQKKESIYWKTGENLLSNEKELKHKSSPLKDILLGMGNFLQSLAEEHAQFENNVQSNLGPETAIHDLVTKEYPNMQKEEEFLRKKQKEYENVESRYNKEKQKRELASDDSVFEEQHLTKEVRLKDELESVTRETKAAEDKFATTLYCIQAKEKETAINLLESLKSLHSYFKQVSTKVNEKIPKLEAILNNSKKSKTFGEDLENHLRVQNLKIAMPLQIGIEGLKSKLKEEGLFRVSPSMPALKKLKASIDAGVNKNTILSKYKDPHLYSSVIKYFLRELPDPLLCSSLIQDWRSVESMKDELEKKICIKQLLEKVPEANKNNLSFLFGFLSKLVGEERYNKMSIENIIVVMSPNLLWGSNGIHIPIDTVYKSMIENYEFIFESQDYDYDEIDSFNTDDCATRRENTEDEFDIIKRSYIARSNIRQNRKRYQTRSSSDDFIVKGKSMGSSSYESIEKLNLINQLEDEENIPKRRETRKISRNLDDSAEYLNLMNQTEEQDIGTRRDSKEISKSFYKECFNLINQSEEEEIQTRRGLKKKTNSWTEDTYTVKVNFERSLSAVHQKSPNIVDEHSFSSLEASQLSSASRKETLADVKQALLSQSKTLLLPQNKSFGCEDENVDL